VARGRQRNIDGWVARARAGTKTAEAAEAATAKATDRDAGVDVDPATRHTDEPMEGQAKA
jgi:bifunctional UDP-N-acetylglucosamine pyrophosphorylase/glucosamine-1-phosphate N-acetyltransferase